MIFPNLTPENSALMVIDVINACAHYEFEDPSRNIHYNKIREMIPRLAEFILAFQSLGGRVVLTTTVPWQESHLPENITELYRINPQARYWSQDTSGRAESFNQIPTKDALIFAKDTYDAFANTELVQALEGMRVRYIIMAGIFGDGCVMASICGAFSRGYHLVIAKDLIETTDDEERQRLQELLKKRTWPLMYGTTTESPIILAALAEGT